MKKHSLAIFDGEEFVSPYFKLKSDGYMSELIVNSFVVPPLGNIQGNIDSKTAKDSAILVTYGSGSMEVNGSKVPFTAGDVLDVLKTETYTVQNEQLNADLQFVSIIRK